MENKRVLLNPVQLDDHAQKIHLRRFLKGDENFNCVDTPIPLSSKKSTSEIRYLYLKLVLNGYYFMFLP